MDADAGADKDYFENCMIKPKRKMLKFAARYVKKNKKIGGARRIYPGIWGDWAV